MDLIEQVASKIEKTGIAERDTPFIYKGFRYITNGHIVVRVKSDGPDSTGEFPKKVVDVFEKSIKDGEFVELPAIPYSEEEMQCKECSGTGKVRKTKCISCDGEGELECDLGHFHECDDCRGDGYLKSGKGDEVSCDCCFGSGMKKYLPVNVGAAAIDARYMKVIASLPDARVLRPADDTAVISFRFNSGDGLVMPLRM